jgi:transposase InsO family protein
MQNGYTESYKRKCRDECLNEQWFETSPQARHCIAEWRAAYNAVRPHSSLGRIPPAQPIAMTAWAKLQGMEQRVDGVQPISPA